MKKIITAIILLLPALTNAQLPAITIAENTIKVGGASEEVFYYGLAAGDQLIFNFEEQKGKELKEIEIVEMPGMSRFMDYKSKKIQNKILQVHQSGVYKFRFANSSLAGRICKFKLERIPASEATVQFNTSVLWKTVFDTVARRVQEPYLVKRHHKAVSIVGPENYFVNGGANSQLAGGKSRITIPVKLPPNTVEWYYTFSAHRNDGETKATNNNLNLVTQIAGLLDVTGFTSLAVDQLVAPPGGDICGVYLLDASNVPLFDQKTDFTYFIEGSRENLKQGTIKITNKNLPVCFIGIKNPASFYGINVSIEAVATVLEEEWGNREVVKLDITPRKVAYLAQ